MMHNEDIVFPAPVLRSKSGRYVRSEWAQRYVSMLEPVLTQSSRWWELRSLQEELAADRRDARAGSVTDLRVSPDGSMRARVRPRELQAMDVHLHLPVLGAEVWQRVLQDLFSSAANLADLLAGIWPEPLLWALKLLIPENPDAFAVEANSARHLKTYAANQIHYCFADEFDRNPWLIFLLRGQSRASLLSQARALQQASSELLQPAEHVSQMDEQQFWNGGALPTRAPREATPHVLSTLPKSGVRVNRRDVRNLLM